MRLVEVSHYYPFGLTIDSVTQSCLTPGVRENQYTYNGKEWQDEGGFNQYDYGARMYDPAVGRWWVVDALAEKMYHISSYTYALNNPLSFIDIGGLIPYPITIRAFAPHEVFGGIFHGNNRGYTTDLSASSKVYQTIYYDTEAIYIETNAKSSPTTTTITGDFSLSETPSAKVLDTKASGFLNDNPEITSLSFSTHTEGANPFTPLAPEIDIFSNFTTTDDKISGNLNIEGVLTGDNFPATEAVITDRKVIQSFLESENTIKAAQWKIFGLTARIIR